MSEGQNLVAAEPPVSKAPIYSGEWYSIDGLYDGEVRATLPDGHWPGMVLLELCAGSGVVGMTLTVEDARELANQIRAAALSAWLAMRALDTGGSAATESRPSGEAA